MGSIVGRATGSRRSVALLLVFLIAPAVLAGTRAPQRGGAEHVHTVTIEQLRFEPAVLVVHRGDRIVWINKDLIPHTVTSVGGAFDSGTISAAGVYRLRARHSGRYSYGCRFHPMMKGKLIVE